MEKSSRQKRIYLRLIYGSFKGLDTINHELLMAKRHAYGFSKNALNLMCSYLKNRRQRVQINNNFSATKTAIVGIPQGSTDRPLLLNLFINDPALFLTKTMLSNYADDNDLLSIGKDINKVKDFGIVTMKTM